MCEIVVEVIYSPERNAQVEIFRRDNGTFGFTELRFLALENCWIPFGRSFLTIIDSMESAIREATGRVDWLSDASKPRSYSLARMRELSHDPNAMFLSSDTPVFAAVARDAKHPEGLGEKFNVKQILQVGGLHLVETIEESDVWYMGDRKGEGPIYCWGSYGPLEDAIKSL